MSQNALFSQLCSGATFRKKANTSARVSRGPGSKGEETSTHTSINPSAKVRALDFFGEDDEAVPSVEAVDTLDLGSGGKKGKKRKLSDASHTSQTNEDSSTHTKTLTGFNPIPQSQVEEEQVRAFRNRMGIRVHGSEGETVPSPIQTFDDMYFGSKQSQRRIRGTVLRNIEESVWKEPTPIQMQSIPLLSRGMDVVGSAPTGSGKTAAFVLPALIRLASKPTEVAAIPSTDKKKQKKSKKQDAADASSTPPTHTGPRVLLLAPTRELADQIHREAAMLAANTGIKVQLLTKARAVTHNSLQSVGMLVATPMRLLSIVRQGVSLSSVEMVVLDEADKLFELGSAHEQQAKKKQKGKKRQAAADDDDEEDEEVDEATFLSQVDELLAACDHPKVQRALFSATMGQQVKELVNTILRNPVQVATGVPDAGASTIDQKLVFVGREEGKLLAFRQLVAAGLKPPVLVFLQSKERAKELFSELVYDGINVEVIHADRTQEQRDAIIRNFRMGKVWVLICTDLMARGIDFKGVNMVVNFDFPPSPVNYIHRIGRTGRAGRKGLAVTFFTEDDMPSLRPIANVVKLSGCEVPDWMLSLKKERRDVQKRKAIGAPPKRHTISTNPRKNKFKRRDGGKKKQGEGKAKKSSTPTKSKPKPSKKA